MVESYEAGADGVYTYNYYTVTHERFDTLGSLETCGPKDPNYVSQRYVYGGGKGLYPGKLNKDGTKYATLNK